MPKPTAGKKEQILALLKEAGEKGITNAELSKVALRYGGYLGTLYKEGYKIDKVYLGNNIYNYELKSIPTVEFKEGLSAKEKLLKAVDDFGTVSKEQLEGIILDLGLSIRHKAGTHNN